VRKDNKPHISLKRLPNSHIPKGRDYACDLKELGIRGRGATPFEAYENLFSLLSIYRTSENRQLRKMLMHGRAYGAGPDSLSKLLNSV
jgi:hypothetical protein